MCAARAKYVPKTDLRAVLIIAVLSEMIVNAKNGGGPHR